MAKLYSEWPVPFTEMADGVSIAFLNAPQPPCYGLSQPVFTSTDAIGRNGVRNM